MAITLAIQAKNKSASSWMIWQQPANWHTWLDYDALAILTDASRQTFLELNTAEQKEEFAHHLWQIVNPEQHYRRIECANKKFSTENSPGALTDRGVIYIKFGSPDAVTVQEAADSSRSEVWSYRSLRGTSFKFIDSKKTGEYRIASDDPNGRHEALTLDPYYGEHLDHLKPLPEPPNEFSSGSVSSSRYFTCPDAISEAKAIEASGRPPYLEVLYLPITVDAVRTTILATDGPSWFAPSLRGKSSDPIEFRGTIGLPAGRQVMTFDGIRDFETPRDIARPRNLIEQMILSPGAYKLDFEAIDTVAKLHLAHVSQTFRVPKLSGGPSPSPDFLPAKTLE